MEHAGWRVEHGGWQVEYGRFFQVDELRSEYGGWLRLRMLRSPFSIRD